MTTAQFIHLVLLDLNTVIFVVAGSAAWSLLKAARHLNEHTIEHKLCVRASVTLLMLALYIIVLGI